MQSRIGTLAARNSSGLTRCAYTAVCGGLQQPTALGAEFHINANADLLRLVNSPATSEAAPQSGELRLAHPKVRQATAVTGAPVATLVSGKYPGRVATRLLQLAV